jgi:multidrug efflux pump
MLSHFFIDRPIFASVISIIIMIAGGVALFGLPIAQYPEITPPQIQVSATYPGASGEVVSQNVASPIEQQVNGADDMIYMYSTSSSTGNMTLNVFFDIARDPDLAQVDVQNRVNLALPQLPQAVSAQGVQIKKVSATFMIVLAIYSPDERYDPTYVANYANLYVLDAIKRIPGANQAAILGTPDYAMRLWVKPDRMAQLGITTGDIVNAVKAQNEQFAVGRVGQPPNDEEVMLTFPVTTKGRLTTPEEFENIILRTDDSGGAAIVKLKDVGRAELGAKDYSIRTRFRGKPATLIAVYQQPGANALQVSEDVNRVMGELGQGFPDGLDYNIALDTTEFVRASIDEVITTFFMACGLVILVVLIFLGNIRATLIPVMAVPVSIIGTFIGMTLFGFSINMLTLFGLVLAIGIVVDDAIVVMENVERNMLEFGLDPNTAAKKAMDEVTGPVVATTLVVLAVFVPVAFLGGITGELYKQFAITISISVVFSSIVALTLSPAMTALILKPGHQKMAFFRWFDKLFDKATEGYVFGVKLAIKRAMIACVLFVALLGGIWVLFNNVPTSFVPAEDMGYLFGLYVLPDGSSLDRTSLVGKQAEAIMMDHPAVKEVATFDGYSLLDGQIKTNAGLIFASLKSFAERGEEELQAEAVVAATGRQMLGIREGFATPINPPPIPGLGTTGGFEFWVQSQGDGTMQQLEEQTRNLIAMAKERPELGTLTTTLSTSSRQLLVDLDREKAEVLGVPVEDVYDALQTLFGSIYVSQFNRYSRLWQVIVQAESEYRKTPEDIEKVYVRNRNGVMVPLSSVVTTRYVTGPDLVTRFNNFPAGKLTGNPAPGYSSGQALNAMEDLARENLPEDYAFSWSGQAYEEKQSGSASVLIFVFGMIMVFLILAAQYESWSLPFSIMMAIPFAIFGALGAIWLRGIENDIYFQIGLVTLVSLAAKNAILIVEFAAAEREKGKRVFDAAVDAARLRIRPICMTAFASILGTVPLAVASGASAKSRHSIGTGFIGGMIGATVIAVFLIPLFYWLLQSMSEKYFGGGKQPDKDDDTLQQEIEDKEVYDD